MSIFPSLDLYYYNDQWLSFNHYSAFSNPEIKECLKQINERIESASSLLNDASYLFITFGTAWVYEFKKSGEVVANCHKIPAKEFKRYLLDIKAIIENNEYFGTQARENIILSPGFLAENGCHYNATIKPCDISPCEMYLKSTSVNVEDQDIYNELLSMDEFLNNKHFEFKIYPNPTYYILNIEAESNTAFLAVVPSFTFPGGDFSNAGAPPLPMI